MLDSFRATMDQLEQKVTQPLEERGRSVRSLRTNRWYLIKRQVRRFLARLGVRADFTERMLNDADIHAAIEETSRL